MSFLAYNENGELQEYESYNGIVKCSHCNKAYRQTVEDQVPGFRDKYYDICPYCNIYILCFNMITNVSQVI